jgi:putative heme-binding domain-containing protein
MIASADPKVQVSAIRLAGTWQAERLADRIRETFTNRESPVALRSAAVEAYGQMRGVEAIDEVVAAIDDPLQEVRVIALWTLCDLDIAKAAAKANALLRSAKTDAEVRDIVTPFLRHQDGTGALAKALQVETVSPDLATKIGSVLGAAGRFDSALDRALHPVAEKDAVGLPEYSESYVRALSAEVQAQGDPEMGAAVYATAALSCAACHKLGEEGGILGPELTAVGAGVPVELLIEAVLWPQRQLKEGYIMTSITTKDGKVISGYIDSEDKSRVIIRDAATGKAEMIPVRKVEARQDAGTLMPPGLTASLSRAELRDLIRFLSDQKGQDVHPK